MPLAGSYRYRVSAMDSRSRTPWVWLVAAVCLSLLPACDCRQRGAPPSRDMQRSRGSGADDIRWDEIGRRVGAPVPTPGTPPAFAPPIDRSVITLPASPRVLADERLSTISLGQPPLAVRTNNLRAPSASRFSYTLVALEETGPRDLATSEHRYRQIVRDGSSAYCVSEGGLDRIDVASGATTHLADGPTHTVAVGETYVYWVSGGFAMLNEPPSTLYRQPKNGGEIKRLYGDLPYVMRLALYGDRIYWIAKMRPRRLMDAPPGYFVSAPMNGRGEPEIETFAAQRPAGLLVGDDAAYILTEGTLGESIGSSLLDGYVLRRPHGEAQWRALADNQAMPGSLVGDDAYLCWCSAGRDDYAIRCVANSGGPIVRVARVPRIRPTLDLRDGELAWTDDRRGVMAVSLRSPASH